ncbi:hypothetical protein IC757_08840 [Wenzhouxiangella sp. AB-CW3]|uniref:hypothetical protein n=1 Tax=Wenzhouxiangella sp. AB-CW3 TaxID=2771012 RepID=UPI00168AE227|nr:hypothetical protein [Wenzhouxiangella sp. AB-CW3]QOC21164.1 hypothetical protein IC757_08840 [Wenzhouxiangella sp. AB-CW3]
MSRTTIIAVFAVFFTPVIVAVLMHSEWFEWRPSETRNYGELLEPPHALPAFEIQRADDAALSRNDLLERWQLIHVAAGPCSEACVETLYWLRQVRRAQDRHQPDIDITLVSNTEVADDVRADIEELAAGIRILDGTAGASFKSLLPSDPSGPISYILDPQANIILRYPDGSDFNGMRRDLRRLLTWTRTDQPPSQQAPEL